MDLLNQIQIGELTLQNKLAMAPMTRSRASISGVVNDLTVLYYTQRAGAGLIISEGINISEQAIGSPFTPGIYNDEQISAWKNVTNAVHKKGGRIIAQLWHTGRVGHSMEKGGNLPVAPSAIPILGQQHYTSQGPKEYETPRELANSEIIQVIQDYRQAAINAMNAGFDGIELHAAFGYLPNQFLAESSNQRNDEYGGSIQNRTRFVLEVMQSMIEAIGENKVGIKLSPSNPYNSIIDSNPTALYNHLIKELDKMPLMYIHLMNAIFPTDNLPQYPRNVVDTFGTITKHFIIANGGYTKKTAEQELEKGITKMISFGALFLANPDLPMRFELNSELNPVDRSTFYGGGEKGYTDYPSIN
jgi:N-ethylmaleimide reductase